VLKGVFTIWLLVLIFWPTNILAEEMIQRNDAAEDVVIDPLATDGPAFAAPLGEDIASPNAGLTYVYGAGLAIIVILAILSRPKTNR